MVVEFKSRYDQYTLATRHPEYRLISFANGLFRTDDEELITILREICALEARGNHAVVEVGHLFDGPALSGILRLSLEGFGDTMLILHEETLEHVMERVAQELRVQQSQHQPDGILSTPVPDSLILPSDPPPSPPTHTPRTRTPKVPPAPHGRGGGLSNTKLPVQRA